MSFLAPLFLLGAIGVALPVIFHFIRRSARERMPFSSLMFLVPTPPQITRRSRLENFILLLLRCLAFFLLAAAFARPYFRKPVAASASANEGRRVAVLVDTSASMRRQELWDAAKAKVQEVLKRGDASDQVSVIAFDRQIRPLVSFDQWRQTPSSEREALVQNRLTGMSPGWYDTRLGPAMITAAEMLEEQGKSEAAVMSKRLVVVSDFQEGARLDGLQGHEWPHGIEVALEPLKVRRVTNASLQWQADRDNVEQTATNETTRVRVASAADSKKEQFRIGWVRENDKSLGSAAVEVYVPPGQTRVAVAPVMPAGLPTEHLRLEGDDEVFDNVIHRVPGKPEQLSVLYLGNEDEKDSAQPLYYLKRAFQQTRRRSVEIINRGAQSQLSPAELGGASIIVVADPLVEARATQVRDQLRSGKTVLVAMKSAAQGVVLGYLADAPSLKVEETAQTRYAMFGKIDFNHPLFAPFADPRYSDFTKIHFWKHRRLDTNQLSGARIIASFDEGDPALLEFTVGQGTLFALTTGWQPSDSQLALSSKFVPLLYSMLEAGGALKEQARQYFVGDEVNLPARLGNEATLRKPDGTEVKVTGGARFAQTDQPGIYAAGNGAEAFRFAVNIAAEESRTAPLALEELSRLGVPLQKNTPQVSAATQKQREEHLQAVELENRQKLWRWLLVGVVLVLFIETAVAGWLSRRTIAQPETRA